MKYKFEIEFDTDLNSFIFLDCDDDVDVTHSGSSYLRMKTKDGKFSGIIDARHNDISCYEGGLKIGAPLKCDGAHMNFFLNKVK